MTIPAPSDAALRAALPSLDPPPVAAAVAPPQRRRSGGIALRPGEGHGQRLTAAFEALERFPALAESRTRVLTLIGQERPSVGEVVAAIESDVALVIAVLRMANGLERRRRARIESIVQAVEVLSPEAVAAVASQAPQFEFFERAPSWDSVPERFRLHAVAVQRAADRVAVESGYAHRDRLLVTALLHDVGKLVLVHAYPGYPRQVHGAARTPEERLHQERRELGVDHALVGGVLTRRWGLPRSIAAGIERHHALESEPEAAHVRLADMLAHYAHDAPVSSVELLKAAAAVGLDASEVRRVLYDLPYPSTARQRAIDPCPLSARELEVLKRLAQGMVYKQIAAELELSTSTVRTHLHNVYGKLGAVDRAQAVLLASERGWLS